ncbi:MAG: tripartite tricarboxylate transporter substrate binding protein [Comamonas sp.]|jgi:tripartite-type tricarboxylate transporter receptor subunit TctC|uniref:Bug family tripartite tricarboxylate transporter substrate binding protein n=1 Tax=Comamonas sp. TaxID=34028 RepID=UPI002827D4C5|nr:tripartite tricarboxylate transporter substrate binding protein [Comamonas sp.]MDR0215604.1 tripartite tricarboxylate transporter substrate binding protein [Comamonas sp.]
MKTIAALALASIILGPQIASAESWPTKPIRLVVPYPAGGGPDNVAREIANKITATNKWTFVVDNRPGSGGNIGTDNVAKSVPDGYSLLLGQTAHIAINATLYPKLPYDPVKDLTAISQIGTSPLAIVVASNSPYKSLADVIAAAKKKPGGLNFATSGNGTVAHLLGEMLQKEAGVKITHIPYKGASQGINDVIGGSVELYISSMPTLIGYVRTGKLRAIAVTSRKRSPDLPEVPTVEESGYKGFEASTWFGFLGPAKLPPDVVAKINAAVNSAIHSPDLKQKLESQGIAVTGSTPEAFAKLVRDDVVRWGKVVRDSGAKVE